MGLVSAKAERVRAGLPSREEIGPRVAAAKALGDPTRLAIQSFLLAPYVRVKRVQGHPGVWR